MKLVTSESEKTNSARRLDNRRAIRSVFQFSAEVGFTDRTNDNDFASSVDATDSTKKSG